MPGQNINAPTMTREPTAATPCGASGATILGGLILIVLLRGSSGSPEG